MIQAQHGGKISNMMCVHTHTQGLSLNTWAQRTAKIYSKQHLLNTANALDRGSTQHWKTMSHKETSLSNGTCKLHHMPQNACEHSNSHRVYNSNEKDYCKYLNQTTSENVRNIQHLRIKVGKNHRQAVFGVVVHCVPQTTHTATSQELKLQIY